MAVDPVGQMLSPRGVREGICAGAEHGDEQRGRFSLAGSAVVNRDRGTRPVDEQLLSGSVILPECDVPIPVPALVEFAEAAIAVAAALLLAVLFPKQLQGDEAIGLHLAVHFREVQTGPRDGRRVIRPGRKQQLVESPVVMIFRQWPGQASGFGPFEIPVNGRLADGATSGYLILSEIHSEPQTQNVFDFSHRQPFLGQMAPSTSQWNEP